MSSTTVSIPIDGSGKAEASEQGKSGEQAQQQQDQGQSKEASGEAQGEGDKGKGNEAPLDPNAALKKDGEGEPAEKKDGEGEAAPAKTEAQIRAEVIAGIDLSSMSSEWVANGGKLSDASYKSLEEKGIPRAMADTFARGVQAQVTERLTDLASTVGGVERYNEILTWGKANLSDTEKVEAVKVLSEGTPDAAKTYLKGLQARFVEQHGKPPSKTSGSGGGGASENLFKSRSEQAAAMRDPRYRTDPKYRREVERKSIASFGKRTRSRTKMNAKTNSRRARSKGSR